MIGRTAPPAPMMSASGPKLRKLRFQMIDDNAGPFVTLPAAYAAIFPRVTQWPKHQLIGLPAVEIYQTARVNAPPAAECDRHLSARGRFRLRTSLSTSPAPRIITAIRKAHADSATAEKSRSVAQRLPAPGGPTRAIQEVTLGSLAEFETCQHWALRVDGHTDFRWMPLI